MESGSSSSQDSTASKIPVIDAEGYTVCPDCDSRINCGTVGIANLEKRHRGKKVCKAAQEKRDKDAKKKKQNGTILGFLKPKTVLVPSMVSTSRSQPASVKDTHPVSSTTVLQSEVISSALQPSGPVFNSFIDMFQNLVNDLPETIPEASELDRLAVFGRAPKEFDNPGLDGDELWETTLNHVLKSALGWGMEENLDKIIRRGKLGLDGLVNFARYFVKERGISPALFEGKLANLLMALKQRILVNHTIQTHSTPLPKEPMAAVAEQDFPILTDNIDSDDSSAGLKTDNQIETWQDDAVIDVNAFEYEDILSPKPPEMSVAACEGYKITFPEGKSPHTTYPFALHDTIILPWDYSLKSGTMRLFARNCSRLSGPGSTCQPLSS